MARGVDGDDAYDTLTGNGGFNSLEKNWSVGSMVPSKG